MQLTKEDWLAIEAEQERWASFLAVRGWQLISPESFLWKHPATGDLHPGAIAYDLAEQEYLRELGWKSISVETHFVLKRPPCHTMAFFVHPITDKIYSYLSAARIAVLLNNQDADFICKNPKALFLTQALPRPLHFDCVYHISFESPDKYTYLGLTPRLSAQG